MASSTSRPLSLVVDWCHKRCTFTGGRKINSQFSPRRRWTNFHTRWARGCNCSGGWFSSGLFWLLTIWIFLWTFRFGFHASVWSFLTATCQRNSLSWSTLRNWWRWRQFTQTRTWRLTGPRLQRPDSSSVRIPSATETSTQISQSPNVSNSPNHNLWSNWTNCRNSPRICQFLS